MGTMLAQNESKKMKVVSQDYQNGSGGTTVSIDKGDVGISPFMVPIPQVGFPKITPKFLNNYERVQSRHRRDMDRI